MMIWLRICVTDKLNSWKKWRDEYTFYYQRFTPRTGIKSLPLCISQRWTNSMVCIVHKGYYINDKGECSGHFLTRLKLWHVSIWLPMAMRGHFQNTWSWVSVQFKLQAGWVSERRDKTSWKKISIFKPNHHPNVTVAPRGQFVFIYSKTQTTR